MVLVPMFGLVGRTPALRRRPPQRQANATLPPRLVRYTKSPAPASSWLLLSVFLAAHFAPNASLDLIMSAQPNDDRLAAPKPAIDVQMRQRASQKVQPLLVGNSAGRARSKRQDDQLEALERELTPDRSAPYEAGRADHAHPRAANLLPAGDHAPAQKQPAPAKLHIVRLFAPDSVQNGTQNVTIDCMFKSDKKLDQRLAIKWFFNDELEPVYQWIPELNKRVFSDKYERFIDKEYRVDEDADFMLEAFKRLQTAAQDEGAADVASADEANSIVGRLGLLPAAADIAANADADVDDPAQAVASRKLLANRLNRLAKLGGDQSRQLLKSLRAALAMTDESAVKYRALRLLKPTLELDGRFTCSVSSLDGDDFKSTRLIVYEPPKSFSFTVSKSAGQMYNLSCQAGPAYPRPTLSLYRYRAGQLEAGQASGAQSADASLGPDSRAVAAAGRRRANRPRLAATALRQELLAGTQTQLRVLATTSSVALAQLADQSRGAPANKKRAQAQAMQDTVPNREIAPEANYNNVDLASEAAAQTPAAFGLDLSEDDELQANGASGGLQVARPTNRQSRPRQPYEISAWALVDERSLSTNLVTQFECVLAIEGSSYEQRQSLGLQRVSAVLIFKLLRRHASKSARVHVNQQVNGKRRRPTKTRPTNDDDDAEDGVSHGSERGRRNGACEVNSQSEPSASPSHESSSTVASGAEGQSAPTAPLVALEARAASSGTNLAAGSRHTASTRQQPRPSSRRPQQQPPASVYQSQQQQRFDKQRFDQLQFDQQIQNYDHSQSNEFESQHSDGIYRVPEQRASSFGTRFDQFSGFKQTAQAVWSTSASPSYSANGSAAAATSAVSGRMSGNHMQANHQLQTAPGWSGNGMQEANHHSAQLSNASVSQPQQRRLSNYNHHHQPATISVNGKQLYC